MTKIWTRTWEGNRSQWQYFCIGKKWDSETYIEYLALCQKQREWFVGLDLKDKRGEKIFTGDVVKWNDGNRDGKGQALWRVAIVEQNPALQFRAIAGFGDLVGTSAGHVFQYGRFAYAETHKHLEIIGHIYECKKFH